MMPAVDNESAGAEETIVTVGSAAPETHLQQLLEQVSEEQAALLADYAKYWDELPQFVQQFGEDFRFYIYARAIDTELAPTQDELDVKFTVSLKVRRPTLKEQERDRVKREYERAAERQRAEDARAIEARLAEQKAVEDGNEAPDPHTRIVVHSEADVQKVKRLMQNLIDDFGSFSKADFYTSVMYTITIDWEKVGWVSLDNLWVNKVRDDYIELSLPKPRDLTEDRELFLLRKRLSNPVQKEEPEESEEIKDLREKLTGYRERPSKTISENSPGADKENAS